MRNNFIDISKFIEARKELEHIKSKGFVIKVNDFKNVKKALGKSNFKSYIDSREAGKWFLRDCNEMEIAASEFACHGLEIDFPIVIFGGEYL